MKKIVWLLLFLPVFSNGQSIAVDPSIVPGFFLPNSTITVTYDVTDTPLANLTDAWAWVWIPDANINATSNISPATSNATVTAPAKLVKSNTDGKIFFTITFTPQDFFDSDISNEARIGILLKGNDWTDGKSSDKVLEFWDGSFQLKMHAPLDKTIFVKTGDQIDIQGEVPSAANFELYVNEIPLTQENGITVFSYLYTVTETTGEYVVKVVATSGGNIQEGSFRYILSEPSPEIARPNGIVAGINYHEDPTLVTLCLWAPGKSSVYLQSDYDEWEIGADNRMRKDGDYFWITLHDVSPGAEYAYRYLVDEAAYVADPFADKILSPEDVGIPTTTYPDLMPFPEKIKSANWYNNRVAVFQTDQSNFVWHDADFQKPEKEKLIIYELLLRDFFDQDNRNFQTLTDTLSYFKRLGVNAIELMPIMEFNGNEGWGYNPTFMLAPDKYYGTKDDLKNLVDACHHEGLAVILDIAMNHQDLPNPYVMMDFDFTTSKPTANNKFFNQEAKHPYNVFYDMNHASIYTKTYLDSITHYWIDQFHVDGYRFDLSKGFTQQNNPTDVGAWGAYDATRIALLERMADKIWLHTPDAYVILEHFADNLEEKELANYKADEGKGMLLWGNLNNAYAQNTMGYTTDSDIKSIYHGARGWSKPHLVGYMESHDEERIMYKNLQYGKEAGSYSIKNVATALDRMKAASVLFYTVPGPKMLWEFGELGYDYSINRCEDATISVDCRLSPKPVGWEYQLDVKRKEFFEFTRDLINMKKKYPVFNLGEAVFTGGNAMQKQLTLKGVPYNSQPASESEMNVQIVVNFDVIEKSIPVNFPHAGVWYEYFSKQAVGIAAAMKPMTLPAGGYKLFMDYPIDGQWVTAENPQMETVMRVYPNPVDEELHIDSSDPIQSIEIINLAGQKSALKETTKNSFDVGWVDAGFYVLDITTTKQRYKLKIVVR